MFLGLFATFVPKSVANQPPDKAGESLVVHCSADSACELAEKIAKDFFEKEPGKVSNPKDEDGGKTIQREIGNKTDKIRFYTHPPGESFKDLDKRGDVDIEVTFRRFTGELKNPTMAREELVAWDGLKIIANKSVDLGHLSVSQIRQMLMSNKKGAGLNLTIYAREADKRMLEPYRGLGIVRLSKRVKCYDRDGAVVQKVSEDPRGVGLVSFLCKIDQTKVSPIQVLSDDRGSAVAPIPEVASDYPLMRPLYFYCRNSGSNSSLAARFIDYSVLLNIQQNIVESSGFIGSKRTKSDAPESFQNAISGYHKQSLYFQFDYGKAKIKKMRNVERLAEYISDLSSDLNRNVDVMLLGFASNEGDSRFNFDLSRKRAEAVKTALMARLARLRKDEVLGARVPILVSDSFGAAVPIEGNGSDPANRRVEVWLKW